MSCGENMQHPEAKTNSDTRGLQMLIIATGLKASKNLISEVCINTCTRAKIKRVYGKGAGSSSDH